MSFHEKLPNKDDKVEDVEESSTDDGQDDQGLALEIDDIGGGGLDDIEDDIDESLGVEGQPLHRLKSYQEALNVAFRRKEIQGLEGKTRLSMADKQLLDLAAAYEEQLDEKYALA